uniref:Uncharacterized protein n=1 Tax=Serinus canaria TaxID=9135 RepID=A0A8C9NXF3_SERCA
MCRPWGCAGNRFLVSVSFPWRMEQRRRWGCSAAMAPMEQHHSVGQEPLFILLFVPLGWVLFGSFICRKV